MKVFTAIITAVILFSILLSGMTALVLAVGHDHASCALPFMGEQTDCPPSGLMSFVHHVESYRLLSAAVMPVAYTLSLLALIASLNLYLLYLHAFSPPLSFKVVRIKTRNKYFNPARLKQLRWLALFENSPSFF